MLNKRVEGYVVLSRTYCRRRGHDEVWGKVGQQLPVDAERTLAPSCACGSGCTTMQATKDKGDSFSSYIYTWLYCKDEATQHADTVFVSSLIVTAFFLGKTLATTAATAAGKWTTNGNAYRKHPPKALAERGYTTVQRCMVGNRTVTPAYALRQSDFVLCLGIGGLASFWGYVCDALRPDV